MRISDWSSDVCSSDLILAAKPFAWVVQQKVRQHPALHDLHTSSHNTCRIITLLSGQGKVDILGAVLRIGTGQGEVDNTTGGGIAAAIDLEDRKSTRLTSRH